MLRVIWRASIWHPDAIPADEWKERWRKRLWLPLWDLILIGAGVWATAYGSPLLHELFPSDTIDVAGIALALTATVCLMGISFPSLWAVEFAGKVTVAFLMGAYAGLVTFYRARFDPASGFVVFILCAAIIIAFDRLTTLGEEWKERHVLRQRARAAAAEREALNAHG